MGNTVTGSCTSAKVGKFNYESKNACRDITLKTPDCKTKLSMCFPSHDDVNTIVMRMEPDA